MQINCILCLCNAFAVIDIPLMCFCQCNWREFMFTLSAMDS